MVAAVLARRYAFPGGLRRVYCYHVEKTAGVSLESAFLALGEEDPEVVRARMDASRFRRTRSNGFVFAAGDADLIAGGRWFFAHSHWPAHRLRLPPDTFTVTILRDPMARVQSLYRYIVGRVRDGRDVPPDRRRWVEAGFERFIERIPPNFLLRHTFMFSSRLDVGEAAERIAACSHVMSTEGFEDGLARLAIRLDLPLASFRHNVSSAEVEFGEAPLERLASMLEPEYRLLARLRREGVIEDLAGSAAPGVPVVPAGSSNAKAG
jgi:hypothetical protein